MNTFETIFQGYTKIVLIMHGHVFRFVVGLFPLLLVIGASLLSTGLYCLSVRKPSMMLCSSCAQLLIK